MSVDLYRLAGETMARADALALEGRTDEAAALYLEAAEYQDKVFPDIPESRAKTRGIVAVTAVQLYAKGEKFEEAIRHAHLYLSQSNLPAFFQRQLEDLLQEAQYEQRARAEGRTLAEGNYVVRLLGSGTRSGIAAVETVAQYLENVKNYAYRIGEFAADLPFRTSGPPQEPVLEAVRPMVVPFARGSFQFGLRLETPVRQLPLFPEGPPLTAQRVDQTFHEVLHAVAAEPPRHLEERVKDPQYRRVFAKLIESLTPDGKELQSVEVRRIARNGETVTVLNTGTRGRIRDHLAGLKGSAPAAPEKIKVGILRAVDLDNLWIRLVEAGSDSEFKTSPDRLFDDVVGPMVNHRVKVEGHLERGRFLVDDITLHTEEQ